jgi:hypothetical protein
MLFFWVSNGLSPKYWRVPKAAAIWSSLGQESKAPAKLHQLVRCGARCFRCFENVSVIICAIIWYVWVVWAMQLCTYRHTVHETCNWVFCCLHIFYACIAQRLWPGNNLQQLCKISVRLGQPDPSWTKNGSAPHPACELGD